MSKEEKKLPIPFVAEVVRDRHAQIIARFLKARPNEKEPVSQELYAKAFDMAYIMASPNIELSKKLKYNGSGPIDESAAVEFAIELLERAKKYY